MSELLSHPVIAILFLLGVLVFFHELGHFLVGKFFGIGVEIFSLGFGPTLLGFQYGRTHYRISWIPLGGYVKFAGAFPGEEVPKEFEGKSFNDASHFAQTCTLAAGPLANFFLAVAVYTILGMNGIEHPAPVIGQVRHGSPAAEAGLESGDKVLQVGETEIRYWDDLQEAIASAPGKNLEIKVQRKEKTLTFTVTPESYSAETFSGKKERGRIGIGYGFLSPVLDLLPGPSVSKEADLEAGLSINKARFEGEEREIQSWGDFKRVLVEAYQNDAKSLELDLESSDGTKVQTRILSTAPWWEEESKQSLNGIELARRLGLTDSELTLDSVEEPANAYLKKGDRILRFGGEELKDIYSFYELLQKNSESHIPLDIQRGERTITLDVQLIPVEVQKPEGKATIYRFPGTFFGKLVAPPPVVEKYDDVFESLNFAMGASISQPFMLVKAIGGLFSGDVPLKVIGGPIMIAKVAGDAAKLGWEVFLTSLALISINLFVVNLFPIPALDGGKLVMIGFEAILRRRLSPEFIENFHKIGFVMLLGLVVLATYNDLSRFWSSILKGLVGVFK